MNRKKNIQFLIIKCYYYKMFIKLSYLLPLINAVTEAPLSFSPVVERTYVIVICS